MIAGTAHESERRHMDGCPDVTINTNKFGATKMISSLDRCKAFGVANIRGIAYMPGPSNYTKGQQSTPYFDSDFYNDDFRSLWDLMWDPNGRGDLDRFKDQLGINFIHCYDWSAPVRIPDKPTLRNHGTFLDKCSTFGMKATIPISNYTLWLLSEGKAADAKTNVQKIFKEIYTGGAPNSPHQGAGMWKIFNEYELSFAPDPAHVVTVMKWLVEFEDGAPVVSDQYRMPIMVDSSFGVKDGIPGAGYIKDVWDAGNKAGKIGSYNTWEEFWKARFVFATNPQNDAGYIKNYLANLLPNYWQTNNIPVPPVMFTELGSSIEQTGSEKEQANWLYAQIEASLPGASNGMMLGACVFLNEERPWEAGAEKTFGIMRFGSDDSWHHPGTNHESTTFFPKWNNEGYPYPVEGTYPVEQQRAKLNYASVANAWHPKVSVS